MSSPLATRASCVFILITPVFAAAPSRGSRRERRRSSRAAGVLEDPEDQQNALLQGIAADSIESAVIHCSVDRLWGALRKLDFAWSAAVEKTELAGGKCFEQIGSIRKVYWADAENTWQLLQLLELDILFVFIFLCFCSC